MKTTKRIISLILTFAIVVLAFTSCALTPQAAMKKADKALIGASYKLSTKVEVSSNNEFVNGVFAGMNNEIDTYVDGNNFSFDFNVSGVKMSADCVDNTAYFDISAYGQSQKFTAKLDSDDREELFETSTAGMEISDFDYGKADATKEDGKYIITFDEIDAEDLNDIVDDLVGNLGMNEMSIKSVSLKIVIADGKYESIALDMATAVHQIAGEDMQIKMNIVLNYDYEDTKKITKPEDISEYTEVDIDDIPLFS